MKNIPLIAIITGSLLCAACIPKAPTPIPTTWYVDADGDSYGNKMDVGTASTLQPSGYVANNTDCNDTVGTGAAINPAASEVNDQIDNDCDGVMNDAPFAIRDYGQAGGRVFYITNGGLNGLESSLINQNSPSGADWGCTNFLVTGADGVAIGTGEQNTADIIAMGCVAAAGSTPAALADAYSLNGYDDWFLPSKDELNAMYTELSLNGVGGFENAYYASSSEFDATRAWGQHLAAGSQATTNKTNLPRVRAVRAF